MVFWALEPVDLVLPAGAGLRIGIVWGGAARAHSNRSLPLRQLTPLFRMPGITWYSLQLGECRAELAQLAEARLLGTDRYDAIVAVGAVTATGSKVSDIFTAIAGKLVAP